MTVDVGQYIAGAPSDQRSLLEELDGFIRYAFPAGVLDPKSYFPVYTLDARWLAGFATRKKGAMFYCMDAQLLDEHAGELGQNRSGKTCVEYRAMKSVTLDDLRTLVPRLLAEQAQRYADGTGGYLEPV